MIEISHLTKKYGNHIAVNDLSLKIEPGKIYGFLGPNGAGKSTTMNMMTGYLGPTEGTITINGVDMLDNPEEAKKNIGYLPEIPPLYMDMTVTEYLRFAAELKGIEKKKINEAVRDVMILVKILDMKDRLIKNLSKGYKQRVGLAQAVLGFPPVIILDEPTVGLDPKQIIEIRELIRNLGEKHTVILSSHILSEIREVCDYIFIISKGKLVASDSTEKLLTEKGKSKQIELRVKGKEDLVKEVLKSLPVVVEKISVDKKEVVLTLKEKDGAKDKEDIREKVFFAFADAKLPIVAMTAEEKSLEEIFLEVTGEKIEKVDLSADETETEVKNDEKEEVEE